MEKRMLVAFALSFAVIILYTRIIAPPRKNVEPPEMQEKQAEAAKPEPTPILRKPAESGILEIKKLDTERKLSTVSTDVMDVTFSDLGGCLENVTLKKSEIIKKGPVTVVKPLSPMVQPVTVTIEEPVKVEPDARYTIERFDTDTGTIVFRKDFGPIVVRKTYHVPREGFVVSMEMEIENAGEEEISFRGSVNLGGGGIFALKAGGRTNYLGVDRLDAKGKVKRYGSRHLKKPRAELEPTRWIAMRNQFFAIVLKSESIAAGFSAAKIVGPDGLAGVRGGLELGGMSLKAGEKRMIPLHIYMGPKEYSALTAFGTPQVIDLGWFGFLGKWILKGLLLLYAICGNYGVAIILLTILIRAILFPLNQKSFRSMKAMQNLQPKIAEMQAKYKDDAKRKQQEMMKIYREHGINPMGGCLPMLLQMPILIAFFRVLQNSIALWGAPFMLWIKDLSEPDALFKIPMGDTTIPFIGGMITRNIDGQVYLLVNVLPLLMLLVFFIQQKMSTTAAAASPEQAKQQKMMSYMMPVMFGFIFYNMPAGLNLYFTASTLLGILQQKYMIK